MKNRQMMCLLSLILLIFVVKIYLSLDDEPNEYAIADSIVLIQYFCALCFSMFISVNYRLKV